MIFGLGLQMGKSLTGFPQDVLFPIQELLLEILKLTLIHELLVLGRTIIRLVSQYSGCGHLRLTPPWSYAP
jgi:hypothetical protein